MVLLMRSEPCFRLVIVADLSHSWMVGDRWKDIAAGQAVNLRTIFVDYHYTEPYEGPPADFSVEDMAFVADIILNGEHQWNHLNN